MDIHVECEPGPNGEPEPLRMRLGTTAIEVVEILDRWPASGHRYFKVRAGDGARYILRQETSTAGWQLTFYQAEDGGDLPSDRRDPGRS
jgi:hypothetical protein